MKEEDNEEETEKGAGKEYGTTIRRIGKGNKTKKTKKKITKKEQWEELKKEDQ